jgi:hypothetical protein
MKSKFLIIFLKKKNMQVKKLVSTGWANTKQWVLAYPFSAGFLSVGLPYYVARLALDGNTTRSTRYLWHSAALTCVSALGFVASRPYLREPLVVATSSPAPVVPKTVSLPIPVPEVPDPAASTDASEKDTNEGFEVL